MEFFNFGLEQKLDHHSSVKFHSDSDCDVFKARKRVIERIIGPKLASMAPIIEFFNFGLEQELDHHSCVKFNSDYDCDGFKAQKPIIDPLIGPN